MKRKKKWPKCGAKFMLFDKRIGQYSYGLLAYYLRAALVFGFVRW